MSEIDTHATTAVIGEQTPDPETYSRRTVLRAGAATTGTVALGTIAGCLSGSGQSNQTTYPLDRDDPRVQTYHSAEKRAYEHYGLQFEEHLIEVDELDLQMRVVAVGTGPPIVMIPGGIGHGIVWLPFLPEFRDYTVYVMDRPGGGLSDGIDHRLWPLATIAASSTKALFDYFDLPAAPIVGNSMGGLWTLRFALAHPERVTNVCLPGCPALYPGTSAPFPRRIGSVPLVGELLFENIVKPDDAQGVRDGLEVNGHPEVTTANLPTEFVEALYRIDNMPYFTLSWVSLVQSAVRLRGAVPDAALTPEDLRNVDAPVSLIWGSNDPFGTIEQGRAGAAYFPDAVFHEMGIGHLPWLDNPEVSGELIRDHVSGSR